MRKLLLKTVWDAEGIFRERPNRFVGIVDLPDEYGGSAQAVHVHDPGRLTELLFPGNRVMLKRADRPGRKTAWTLMAAQYQGQWVLVNSGLHRQISFAILGEAEISPLGFGVRLEPEVKFGNSRLDYRVILSSGETVWVEVKGCTLARGRVALFPDAPTDRGTRHVMELLEIIKQGERAALLILIFRNDAQCFSPNAETDPKFAAAFKEAVAKGVEVYPVVCSCSADGSIFYERDTVLC